MDGLMDGLIDGLMDGSMDGLIDRLIDGVIDRLNTLGRSQIYTPSGLCVSSSRISIFFDF